jgi:metal-sulfur cluster biosynthetic enzyme
MRRARWTFRVARHTTRLVTFDDDDRSPRVLVTLEPTSADCPLESVVLELRNGILREGEEVSMNVVGTEHKARA